MAEIISELISLLKIKDIIQSEGRGAQDGPPAWAKPGAEIEGIVLGSKGPLDIISIDDHVIRARADEHLPIGARVQFRVMDVGVPMKVKLLSVMTQPQEERRLAMDFLAAKAGIPRVSNMLSLLLKTLSNYKAGLDQSVQPGDIHVENKINAALQRAASLLDAISLGDKPSPEKIGALFTLMSVGGNDHTETDMIPLRAIFKDVLDDLIAAKDLNTSRDVLIGVSENDSKQNVNLSVQGMKQDLPPERSDMSAKAPLDVYRPGLGSSSTAHPFDRQAPTEPPPEAGQVKTVLTNTLSDLNIPPRTTATNHQAFLSVIKDETLASLRQSGSQDVVQPSTKSAVNTVDLNALVQEDVVIDAANKPLFQSQARPIVKDTSLTKDLPADPSPQEGIKRSNGGINEKEGARVIPDASFKKDIPQTEDRHEGNLSQIFDMNPKEKLLGSAVQGLKTISEHLDAIQNYQGQIQARFDTLFFVVPFWFENATGFGNCTYWTDGENKTDMPNEPVSHLIFDLDLKGLGSMMIRVTLRKDTLNLKIAAAKDALSDIRSGMPGLIEIMQGLGYRLEISGIIPIDEADQVDFSGPLTNYPYTRSSLHLIT